MSADNWASSTSLPSTKVLTISDLQLKVIFLAGQGLLKGLVDREADSLRLRPPGGVADQCSHARRILIDEWARKIRSVAFRQSVAVVQIDKPAWGQKIGDADNSRAAKQPAGTREVLGRARLIDDAAIDKCKTDQAIQPSAGL